MRAVIGPNGAGKTTMMDVITGKTRPDTGKVVFGRDTDLTKLDEPAIASLGIGRKFQKPTVFEPHTVWDNLLLALAGDRAPRFTPVRPADSRRKAADRVDPGDDAADRSARPPRRPICRTGRSSGWKSACCWRRSRSLLLVDEPVAGMTDAETEQTADLLREINRTRSVVVVEHDMAFVRALGVKVTVLHEGLGAVRGLDRLCQRRSEGHRSVSGALMLEVENVDLYYGAAIALRQVSHDGRGRRGDLPARPQRRRQDLAAAGDRRRASDRVGLDPMGRGRNLPPADV